MSTATQLRRPLLPRIDLGRTIAGVIGSTAVVAVVVMGTIVAVDSAYYRSIVVPISERKGFPFWLKGPLQTFVGDRLLADPYGKLMLGMFAAYVIVVVASRWVPLPLIVAGIVV